MNSTRFVFDSRVVFFPMRGQQILVMSFLRRIIFIGVPHNVLFVYRVIKDLLYNPYRFSMVAAFFCSNHQGKMNIKIS